MYAIVKHGGHQYRVSAGDRLLIDRIAAEVGSTVTLESVLLLADGDSAQIGGGTVSDATVTATVLAHRRGRKLRVFTFKPKKRRRRTLGYRSQLTELRIEELGRAAAKPQRAAAKVSKPRSAPSQPEKAPAEPVASTAAAGEPVAATEPAAASGSKARTTVAPARSKAATRSASSKRARAEEPADGA